MSTPLAGKSALVTGASKGIGAETARALAAAGARVAMVARSADALASLAKELGPASLAVTADLADAADAERAIAAVRAWASGAPDIVVNNVGAFAQGRVEKQSPEGFAGTLRVNLEANFRVTHAFVAEMRTRGHGDVVSIGSVADKTPYPGNAAYSASKYGLRAVHEVLRAETRGTGVRAILISPGPVDTDIWNPVEAKLGDTLPARSAMMHAEDVAAAILFTVSQPPHVTVEELRLSPR